jgi:hypothetical protein
MGYIILYYVRISKFNTTQLIELNRTTRNRQYALHHSILAQSTKGLYIRFSLLYSTVTTDRFIVLCRICDSDTHQGYA